MNNVVLEKELTPLEAVRPPILLAQDLSSPPPSLSELKQREVELERILKGPQNHSRTGTFGIEIAPPPPPPSGKEIEEIERELVDLKHTKTVLSRFPNAQRFEPEVLGALLDSHGFPKLAPFPLDKDSHGLQIEVTLGVEMAVGERDPSVKLFQTYGKEGWLRDVHVNHNLPSFNCVNAYRNFLRRLAIEAIHVGILDAKLAVAQSGSQSQRLESAVIARAEFGSDLIPQESKDIIIKAINSRFFENVYLVAEVDRWTLSSGTKTVPIQAPRNLDPLLIGEHGGVCWMLHAFNLTPAEQYALDEHTIKPLY